MIGLGLSWGQEASTRLCSLQVLSCAFPTICCVLILTLTGVDSEKVAAGNRSIDE